MHAEALRQGHGHGYGGSRAGAHILDQGPIVKGGFQFVLSRAHFLAGGGHLTKQIEQPLVFNQSRILQGIGYIVHVRMGHPLGTGLVALLVKGIHRFRLENGHRQRHHSGKILLVQRQHITGRHPGQTGQHHADADGKHKVHNPAHAAGVIFLTLAHRMVVPLRFLVSGVVVGLLAGLVGEQLVHRFHRGRPPLPFLFLRLGRRRLFLLGLLVMDAENLIDFINIA